MTINNSREFLAQFTDEGLTITDHFIFGKNRTIAPGTYTPDEDTGEYDAVTFVGTAGRDTLIGGGGELFDFFLGTRGDDLYGSLYGSLDGSEDILANGYADYSAAPRGIIVDMSYRGSATFTDEAGVSRTVATVGQVKGGFGGTDQFTELFEDFSSVFGVFGTSRRDVMIAGGGIDEFYGVGGNDLIIGGFAYGGTGNDLLIGSYGHGDEGNDRLIGRATGDGENRAFGGEGNDLIIGTDFIDYRLVGGDGNDRIIAKGGDDRYVVGGAGNDYIDGGDGDDFIDGGVGKDVLISGAGNDTINPDVEFFQIDSDQPTDGARDVIRVTRHDLGDFTDLVLSRSFEAGVDEIRFRDAVKYGVDYRVFYEDQTVSPTTGQPRPEDLADVKNTVLQIDWNRDGFGAGTPDAEDYFISVLDVTMTEHGGFLLT